MRGRSEMRRHRNGGPEKLRQRSRCLAEGKRKGGNTGGSPRGNPKTSPLRRLGIAEKVANLGRDGRLERVKPAFPLVRLWRAARNTRKQVVGEAQERIGLLGRPAGGKEECPREGEAHEGRVARFLSQGSRTNGHPRGARP
jgi:hypothetical protein